MYAPLKISSHEHSGRLRPHEHTSYLPLAFLVLLVGVVLGTFSLTYGLPAFAASPGPQSGSIGLSGEVPAKPPTVAATITSPKTGLRFVTTPTTISGTCPTDTLVEIYKNNIFAGSTPCDSKGKFSVEIDLLYGENTIMAQVYDNLNQGGPTSGTITLFYDAALPTGANLDQLSFGGDQLILNTNSVYRGGFPDQTLNVPITIAGGTPPYAVNAIWGDSSNNIIPRSDNTLFNASHSYKKPGTYKITLAGTDSKNQVAFLTVAAVINGQPSVLGSNSGANSGKKGILNKLLVLWPLYAITVTMLTSFWLGERREKKILHNQVGTTPPPLGMLPH